MLGLKKRNLILIIITIFINFAVYAQNYEDSGIYSKNEINYIKEIQKSELRIGVHTGSIYLDQENSKESIAYKYKSLLKEFFEIDTTIEVDSWKNLYKKLEEGKIDLLLNFTLSESQKEKFNLSIPIYYNELYIVANNKNLPLRYLEDLEGKEIAVLGSTHYSEYLKKFKNDKKINITVTEVDSLMNIPDFDYSIVSRENIYNKTKPILKLGQIDPIGIGIRKDKHLLKAILDKSLTFSHKEKLLEMFERERLEKRKNAFYKLLNHKEIEYLNNKKQIRVAFGSDSYPTSYYDDVLKKYDGSFVRMMKEISQFSGVPLEIVDSDGISKKSLELNLEKNEIDIRGMLFTSEAEKKYNFSKPLIYKDIILVSLNTGTRSDGNIVNKVGVIKNSILLSSVDRYFSKNKKLIEFSEAQDMVEALKNKMIDSCIMNIDMFNYFQQKRFDINLYRSADLDKLPLAAAVNKNDVILCSILDKATDNFLDYRKIEDKFVGEMSFFKTVKVVENTKNKKIRLLILTVFGIITSSFLMGMRYFSDRKLKNLAYYDQLTTALNRVSFKESMNKVSFTKDRGIGMYIDLDDFKIINDNYEHHAGDMILKQVVSRLQKVFKKDTVYRLAGDEFFIFEKNISVREGIKLAEVAIAELNKPVKMLDTLFNVGASIGICELHEEIDSLDYFMHKADIAMYTAKKNGRGSIVVANKDLVREFEESKTLEKDFKVALQKNEIIPYFQPKVDLSTKKIVGLEALARWIHPQRGVVSPDEFIPMAEQIGLIYKVDMKIAEITIRTVKEWFDRGIVSEDFKVSFNISIKTFDEIDVYEHIKYLLDKYKIPGKAIEIELTESIFIKKFSKILGELNHLKDKLGTSVALDDFTAGYSSLRELGKLSVDSLKFDRSLLQSVKENAVKGKKIYRTLIKLCNDMDYSAVAEGIEDASESDFLKSEGVKYAQGFYFGRPMTEKSFIDLLNLKNSDT